MRCPSLDELPSPPAGKTGWPWTEESSKISEDKIGTRSWPRVTIVTPSFNQGRFIEETIRSILLQGYPDLEYFVLDGGSTDNSVEIIKKYSRWITFWTSERDGGQSTAINRGLKMGSGFWATWINSDDMLCENALKSHLKFLPSGSVLYVGDCIHIDESGNSPFTRRGRVESFEDLIRIDKVWRSGGSIDQPAVVFPRDLAIDVGGLNENNHHSMDYELWGRLLLAGAAIHYTRVPVGIFRHHQLQKTANMLKQTESLIHTATALLAETRSLPTDKKDGILADLNAYWESYPDQLWRDSGRLAKIGIPAPIVTIMRSSRNAVARTFGRLGWGSGKR